MAVNDEGKLIDLYIPRKCSATNRVITAKDHASVQIAIAHLDQHGVVNGSHAIVAFSGFLREQGQSDAALNRLAAEKKLIKDISKFPTAEKVKSEAE